MMAEPDRSQRGAGKHADERHILARMENEDGKRNLKIILGVLGCVGCLGVLGVFALTGVGFWIGSVAPPSPPSMPHTVPAPVPPVPPTPQPAPPTPAPGGWTTYEHTAPCPNNPNLRLARFRASYPAGYIVLPCQDQEPRPWSYVTFHLEDAAGNADKQLTLAHSHGAPTQAMLAEVTRQFVSQLGAAPPRELNVEPLEARSTRLMRRDAIFHVPSAMGVFAPGAYLNRQVVVPGPGAPAEGIIVQIIHRVRTNEEDALAESDETLMRAVASIEF